MDQKGGKDILPKECSGMKKGENLSNKQESDTVW